jgi:hypothetical protein
MIELEISGELDDIGSFQTAAQFRAQLLRDIYRSHNEFIEDSFDLFRFGFDADPRFMYVDNYAAYLDYVLANLDSIFAASLVFDDQASRNLFTRLIKFRCVESGQMQHLEGLDWPSVQKIFGTTVSNETGPSCIDFSGV